MPASAASGSRGYLRTRTMPDTPGRCTARDVVAVRMGWRRFARRSRACGQCSAAYAEPSQKTRRHPHLHRRAVTMFGCRSGISGACPTVGLRRNPGGSSMRKPGRNRNDQPLNPSGPMPNPELCRNSVSGRHVATTKAASPCGPCHRVSWTAQQTQLVHRPLGSSPTSRWKAASARRHCAVQPAPGPGS